MNKYSVFAFNDQDDKLKVYQSASLEQAVSVACALFSACELEFKILDSSEKCIVTFFRG